MDEEIKGIAESCGLAKFFFKDGKAADGMFIISGDFIEKFAQALLSKDARPPELQVTPP